MKQLETIPVRINGEYSVEFTDLTYEGLGVAKVDGFPVFVEDALPGETAVIEVVKLSDRFAFGKVKKLEIVSEERIEVKEKQKALSSVIPLQHLAYPAQLVFKRKLVLDVLAKEPAFKTVIVKETLGMKNPWHYRNKAQVPVRVINGKLVTGVFANHSHRLQPIQDFRINLPGVDEVIAGVRDILSRFGEKGYDSTHHTGNIRHIIVRKDFYKDEVMVTIVTRSKSLFPVSKIVPAIVEAFPQIVSIIHNINPNRMATILGETSKVIFGTAYYHDQLLGNTFQISSRSFFQVNTLQAEVLYQTALDMLALTGTETVLDAYCGLGTITLSLAKQAKFVYGVEVEKEAVALAQTNAELNGVENISYEAGLAESVLASYPERGIVFDAVVVDPPRKGLDLAFCEQLIAMSPQKILYISCNPATLVRDLKLFSDAGYQVGDIQPVDMFPQTFHVETVALLSKLDVDKHINIEIELDELDLTSAESKATYAQIKEYVWNKFELKVPTLYIAQIKRKCGIELREHYNKSKKEKQIIPQCTPEKEEAIMDALRHFKMI